MNLENSSSEIDEDMSEPPQATSQPRVQLQDLLSESHNNDEQSSPSEESGRMRGLTERFGNSQMMMLIEEEEEKQINQALRTHSVMNTLPP